MGVCLCVGVWVYLCAGVWVYLCAGVWVCVCVCVDVCVCVYGCVGAFVRAPADKQLILRTKRLVVSLIT